MTKKKYNVIDLFCGCGGLSYGLEQAGFDVLLGIDNEEVALKTFELNHKNSKTICGDITKISAKENIIPIIGKQKIDVIVGGPPCQGMSLSGPRKFDDPRNKLYLSFIRIVNELQPKAFIIENVPGLAGLFKGEIRNNILERFEEMGYIVRDKILCAADLGVPQSRNRIFFVGFKNTSKEFSFPEEKTSYVTCEMALSDLAPLENDTGTQEQEYYTESQNYYQSLMRKGSNIVKNHIEAAHSQRVRDIIALVLDGLNYKSLPEELRNTRNFNVAWTRFTSNKPSPTIDTGHRHHFHYKFNRVPTVRECARLQSFPDTFEFLGNKTQQFWSLSNRRTYCEFTAFFSQFSTFTFTPQCIQISVL